MKILTFIFLLMLIKPVFGTEFTIHHAPGGPSDKTTRIIHKYLPTDYVVVNRPGAQGKIAVKHIMTHDSLMLATMAQIYVTNKLLGSDYNPDTDLKVIANIGSMPSVLVCNSSLNLNSIPDIIKSKELSFAVAGIGSSEHLATEVLFKKMNRKHLVVPYSTGGSKSILDMLGGHVDCMFANYPTVKEHINDKRLKILLTSHQLNLNVVTWEELYNEKFPFQATLAIVMGSKNTNTNIVRDLNLVLKNDKVKQDLKDIGIFPILGNSKKDIDRVLQNNQDILSVILDNRITLK